MDKNTGLYSLAKKNIFEFLNISQITLIITIRYKVKIQLGNLSRTYSTMCINKIPFLQVVEELKLEIKPLRLFRLASHSTHNDAKSFVKLEESQVQSDYNRSDASIDAH